MSSTPKCVKALTYPSLKEFIVKIATKFFNALDTHENAAIQLIPNYIPDPKKKDREIFSCNSNAPCPPPRSLFTLLTFQLFSPTALSSDINHTQLSSHSFTLLHSVSISSLLATARLLTFSGLFPVLLRATVRRM
ncbi:hypothetical protein AVEN_8818-1 [Araneus ventricosus]|uniref:Uncharacterized protein n=1 Tax=Araneus ventricosus TaxID=182803 RepID=A0A4Y2TUC2_ARAVE|nr:hypothetical protein AVEN_8818-1 [Araneus ventricosus]